MRERAEEEADLAKQMLEAKNKRIPTLGELSQPTLTPRGPLTDARADPMLKFTKGLHREEIMPLVDLAYSESPMVKRSAIGLLATLSINADNMDMLLAAGSLKPLLACCVEGVDLAVRRHALSGLAHLTAREDIRHRVCAVPDGLAKVVQGVWCRDVVTRQTAAECVANVAASLKLRGKLVEAGVLPALSSLLLAKNPELKRLGMVALQRLATSRSGLQATVTKEDPEGDGYALEIMQQGVLVPLLKLLRGGPDIEEGLRTQAMRTLFEMVHSSDELKVKLCNEHREIVTVVIGLLLLDENLGRCVISPGSPSIEVSSCSTSPPSPSP